MREFRVTIDGRTYIVEIGDLSQSPIPVTVNGKAYQVQVELGLEGLQSSGEVAVSTGGPPGLMRAESRRVTSPGRPPIVAGGPTRVTAPLPGRILQVRVQVGDRVAYGDELCVLEAMKMENSIRAPRAAVVEAVAIVPSQLVATGDLLVELA